MRDRFFLHNNDQRLPARRSTVKRASVGSGVALRTLLLALALVAAGCEQAAAQHAPDRGAQGIGSGGAQAEEGGAWLTFGDDPSHESVNTDEKALTAANVSKLHVYWNVQLPDLADERPILVRNLTMPDGKKHDVLYVTTDKGTLMALNAANGKTFWAVTPRSNNPKYTKASPAADPANNLIYSYGLDGRVHRFQLTTGKEVLGNNWPVLITKMPLSEKVSSALNLINGYLYVTTASFSGDAPPYQGHMVAINVKTGESHVFNSLCNTQPAHILALNECPYNGGGIWARPAVVEDPVTGHIFFTTSDGYFTANKGGTNWGDSIIEMTPDGSTILDSYTPENYAQEAFQNRDLGSTAPVMLPEIPKSKTPYLAVQAGKEGLLRVVNRQNLSGQGGPGHVGGEIQTVMLPDLCPTLAQPVAWQDPSGGIWLFVATLCHMDAFKVVTSPQGITRLQKAWYLGVESTSPVMAGGMLFAATSHALLALNPFTGQQLWSSAQPSAGGSIAGIHWETPIVVGGVVYCPDETGQITAYSI
jgi:outer membrane protein assembly factor BamB